MKNFLSLFLLMFAFGNSQVQAQSAFWRKPIGPTGTVISSTSAVNLATLGTLSWIHYGNDSTPTRKSGTQYISNFYAQKSLESYTSMTSFSWTGGTPTASGTSADSYWFYGVGKGYRITAPAGNQERTLKVYVHIYSGDLNIQASLSDGSSSVFTTTTSAVGDEIHVITITYKSTSQHARLNLEWVGANNSSVESGIAAATLKFTGASGTAGSITGSAGIAATTVNLTVNGTSDWVKWTSNSIIRKATPLDIIGEAVCIGCDRAIGAYSDTIYGKDMTWTDGSPTTSYTDSNLMWVGGGVGAHFRFTAPASTAERTLYLHGEVFEGTGRLTVTIGDGSASTASTTVVTATTDYSRIAVTYSAASATTATFDWEMTATTGGGDIGILGISLVNTGSIPAVHTTTFSTATDTFPVNLTTEGTSDWIHWLSGNYIVRKSTGGNQISDALCISCTSGRATGDARSISWTGGTPIATGTGNTNYFFTTGIGSFIEFYVAAEPIERELEVFVGGFNSGGTLSAWMSDSPQNVYKNKTVGISGSYDNKYTLKFKSIKPGQYLAVRWELSTDTGGGTIRIAGAALRGAAGPAVIPPSINITSATYGATSTCDASSYVSNTCNGLLFCPIISSNSICGDPQNGTVKNLIINYTCFSTNKSISITEGQSGNLQCP